MTQSQKVRVVIHTAAVINEKAAKLHYGAFSRYMRSSALLMARFVWASAKRASPGDHKPTRL